MNSLSKVSFLMVIKFQMQIGKLKMFFKKEKKMERQKEKQ